MAYKKIVNLRASMNNGLSDMLKAAFPETKPVPRLDIEFQGIPNPNWVSGFVEGEGCFLIRVQEHKQFVQKKAQRDHSHSTFSGPPFLSPHLTKVR